MTEPSVLLVAIPGLLAESALELIDAGALGALEGVIEEGAFAYVSAKASGNVTRDLWTIATGVPPSLHGVAGPYCVASDQSDIYPLGRETSRCMPLWEVAATQGLESCCIGWPGTRGAPVENLLAITEDVYTPFGEEREGWPLLPGAVDSGFESELAGLRVHPSEIGDADVEFFGLPQAITPVRCALAAAATVQALAVHVMAKERHRIVAVHFDFMDRLRRLAARSSRQGAVLAGYRFIDLLLGTLKQALPENGVLAIASPSVRLEDGTSLAGLLAILGGAMKQDAVVADVAPEDVAPTVLAAAGAAIPQSCTGRVRADLWRSPPQIRRDSDHRRTDGELWIVDAMRRAGLKPPKPLADKRHQIQRLLDREAEIHA